MTRRRTSGCSMLREHVTWLVLLACCCACALDYSEVSKLGGSCPRLDSCAHLRESGRRQLVGVRERNCACDYLCAEYGDCCVDAPTLPPSPSGVVPDRRVRCHDLKQFGGVYMRDSCPPTYRGPEDVRRLCEETRPGDVRDPLGSMPVTDAATGLTYRNLHCSLCDHHQDGRATDDLVLWTPRLECPLLMLFNRSGDGGPSITDEYVVRNLATDGHGWGLYLENGDGGASGNSSLFFHDCDVDPVMPRALQDKIRLCRPGLVSECDPSWRGDQDTRRLCGRYAGARYLQGGPGYRNVHCALCNGVNVSRLSCQSAELRGVDIFRMFAAHSFALLLDVNEGRGSRVGQVRMCGEGEVFDPFFKRCRSLTCLPGHVRRGRRCVSTTSGGGASSTETPPLDSNATTPSSAHNLTSQEEEKEEDAPPAVVSLASGQSLNVSDAVGRFLDCLLISLADEDTVMLANGTLFVPKYDRSYEPTAYHASDGSVLVCTPFESGHAPKFLPLLGYVTVAGLGASMFFLTLHFAAFCAVPDLRNLSGKNLASQCLALFLGYLCFVAGQFESLAPPACALVAFLTFYFFQVSFFWMAVMAYDVWRTLRRATTELRVSGGRQPKRFCAYSLLAWTAPLLEASLLAVAEYTDLFPTAYRPGFGPAAPCWFRQRRSLLVFFAAPLLAVMLANGILFAASARMIVVTTGQTRHQQSQQRRRFSLYLRLALLMGLTWAVGLVAAYADLPVLFHLFVVLNTLQGLFVFVAFTCTAKVLGHLRNRFLLRPGRDFSKTSSSSGFASKPTTTFTIRNG